MEYDRFISGDEAALKDIYQEFSPLIMGLSRRLVGQDAADLTQTVFISAWNAREKFDPNRGSMKTWLCGIARNAAFDLLRKRSVRPQFTAELNESGPLAASEINEAEAVVDSLIIQEALQDLPDERRQVITLGFVQGLTHEQISSKTNIALGTVKSHIKRGLEQLQAELGGSRESI